MKEAWENIEVGTKKVPHRKIYPKTFFPEFLKYLKNAKKITIVSYYHTTFLN
jgi:hypothetical protein